MKNQPKVLFWDIETSPCRAYIWRTGKQWIGHDQVVKGDETKIICIAYRWEHQKTSKCLTFDLKTQDSSKLVDDFTKIVEQADVVIAHNGDKFDCKHLNTQRLLAGQPPIHWPTTEDTLKQLRKVFYFPTYRLDYISKVLLGEGKSPMTFQDWIDIVEHKSEKALKKMVRYCKRDVDLMAEAYAEVKPFIQPRANRGLITSPDREGLICPSCSLHEEGFENRGKITLKAGRYRKYRCNACGHSFRGRKKV